MCVCVCVCVCARYITHVDPCLSGHILSISLIFFLPVAARCLLWRLQVYWGSGVKRATECVRMFVSERVYIRAGFCACMYSKRVFVCPVILGTVTVAVYF